MVVPHSVELQVTSSLIRTKKILEIKHKLAFLGISARSQPSVTLATQVTHP